MIFFFLLKIYLVHLKMFDVIFVISALIYVMLTNFDIITAV